MDGDVVDVYLRNPRIGDVGVCVHGPTRVGLVGTHGLDVLLVEHELVVQPHADEPVGTCSASEVSGYLEPLPDGEVHALRGVLGRHSPWVIEVDELEEVRSPRAWSPALVDVEAPKGIVVLVVPARLPRPLDRLPLDEVEPVVEAVEADVVGQVSPYRRDRVDVVEFVPSELPR